MDDYLLELGLSDIKIQPRGHEEPLTSEQLKLLMETILDVETLITRIERKGIAFREFMRAKNDQGILPRFQVNLMEGQKFAYSYDELESLRKSDEESQRVRHTETLASIPEDEVTAEMKTFHLTRLNFMELYEEDHFNELMAKLKTFGYDLSNYLIADGVLVEAFSDSHKDGDRREQFHTLRELIDHIRNNGRLGIEIQRYKGLAEMNPDQLWETTMDPTTRTLIRVTVPDMVAADYMFTMLMGEEVPPRRAFIEQHALSVKNLDI